MNDEIKAGLASGAPASDGQIAGPPQPVEASGPASEPQPMETTVELSKTAGPAIKAEAKAVSAEIPPAIPEPEAVLPKAAASIRLEKKHLLAIRWMHWINFPILAIMIWSGLLIYWGDSQINGQNAHQVYRVGVGSWTLFRFFPAWFWEWYGAAYKITVGLGYHFLFMWVFLLNGVAYVLYTLISGEWRYMVPNLRSFREAIEVTLYDLHLRKQEPPKKKYNGAQKIAYTSVILMGLGSLVTGLAIYKPSQAHLVTLSLGGYEVARWLHFWLTIGFCVFFVIHVAQVIRAGWNNFRSMVSGYEVVPANEPPYRTER